MHSESFLLRNFLETDYVNRWTSVMLPPPRIPTTMVSGMRDSRGVVKKQCQAPCTHIIGASCTNEMCRGVLYEKWACLSLQKPQCDGYLPPFDVGLIHSNCLGESWMR